MEVFFYLSSFIQSNVMVKIHAVMGLPAINALEQKSGRFYSKAVSSAEYELYVEVELFQKGYRLGLPVCCTYRLFPHSAGRFVFDEWVKLPVRICDINRDAQLVFTIFAVSPVRPMLGEELPHRPRAKEAAEMGQGSADWIRLAPRVVGGVTLPLFDQRILRYGRQKLRVLEGVRGDGSIDSQTLFWKLNPQLTVRDKLEAVLTRKQMRHIPKVDWLDGLTNRRISKVMGITTTGTDEEQKGEAAFSGSSMDDVSHGTYLVVDLPNLGHDVYFYQQKSHGSRAPKLNRQRSTTTQTPRESSQSQASNAPPSAHNTMGYSAGGTEMRSIRERPDRERDEERKGGRNTAEIDFLLVHDPDMKRVNPVKEKDLRLLDFTDDGDIKPDKEDRDRLNQIIKSPSRDLSDEDRAMLWRFRNSLVDNKKALTKFLRSFSHASEEHMAVASQLLAKWAPIDVADALELLGGTFEAPEIRSHAIEVLEKRATDHDLESYIMQLVQAIRFERSYNSDLPQFLLRRSLHSEDFRLFNFLFWSVKVQSETVDMENNAQELYTEYLKHIEKTAMVENLAFMKEVDKQKWLVNCLIEMSEEIQGAKGRADDKKKKLRQFIATGKYRYLKNFTQPIRCPVRPDILVTGIVPEKCSVFKSAMCPFLLCFRRAPRDATDRKAGEEDDSDEDGTEWGSGARSGGASGGRAEEKEEHYRVIWKNGDDLRQDQLIIQMFRVMDDLLKSVKLNLCLTPYPVLATGEDHGMLEFVEGSSAVAALLKTYNSKLTDFLDDKKGKHIQKALDRFVRSCAGYCVITFILGIGDRHLDNLLMCQDGRLFHIDFGFIYGDDPKPWPPPMKICKPMIDCMGGYASPMYKQFQEHMTSCYNLLRRNANLILNLLALMGQGSLQETDRNLTYVHSKFRLELSDPEAAHYLLGLVKTSVDMLFAKFTDRIHDWATYWR